MGMCKGCGVVYSALVMKNGYCRDCKPGLFSEDELKQTLENEGIIINNNEELKNEPKSNKELIVGGVIGGILLLIVGYFIYSIFTKPSDEIVKKIASSYNVSYSKASDINIIKSYEDKGKLVYILNIKNMICEMPMINVNGEWLATGINCTR